MQQPQRRANRRYRPLEPLASALLILAACGPNSAPQQRSTIQSSDLPPATVAPTPDPTPPEASKAPAVALVLPSAPILDATIRAARDRAQARQLLSGEAPQPDLLTLDAAPADTEGQAETLPGYFVPLALPAGAEPLARFESALAELEAGTRSESVHVAIYGASGVAADRWTGYIRAYLQARFGDGGPGIVAGAAPHKWSRHQEIDFEGSSNWTKRNAFRLGETAPTDFFGVMGQAMSADAAGAWTKLTPHRSAPSAKQLAFYEVHYLVQPEGGSFELSLDGTPLLELSTAGKQVELGRHRVELRPGQAHSLRLELLGDGPVRLLGTVAETTTPGVIVDTLGVNGAKTADHRRWDIDLWAQQLQTREPVLYVLAYGNNEAVDDDVPIADYERDYIEVLERFAATLPNAGCVMVGPGDYPLVEAGEVLPRPRLAQIRAVQLALAPAYGCAFLDARAIIGGEGAIADWVEADLAKHDHLHLKRPGYLRFGLAVGDALMQHYDWLAASSSPEAAEAVERDSQG